MTQKKADGSRHRRGARPNGAPSDAEFDGWLNRQLHGLYDPVLSEEVPAEIMKLIERFDDRPRPSHGDGDGDGASRDKG